MYTNPLKNASTNEVRGALLLLGSDLTKFARQHEFPIYAVRRVMSEYCGKDGRPNGLLTTRILDALAAAVLEANQKQVEVGDGNTDLCSNG